ncbi:hypothetical protein [Mesorhizobium sp. CN2-181]|uniref:hypothetical protein n=1 Tax=Mesorhizobium yinganensis TaxID=3157707 RepID=UPI0032B73F8B
MQTMEAFSLPEFLTKALALVWSARGLNVIGQACNIAALLLLAFDIRRVHADISTKKAKGVADTEKWMWKRLEAKQIEIAKDQDARNWQPQRPLTQAEFHREVGEIILWHQKQLELLGTAMIFNAIDAKVSTGKSKRAVLIATGLAVAGILFQIAALFIESVAPAAT